jgi:membrane protein YqaA with SNARE-associated domain
LKNTEEDDGMLQFQEIFTWMMSMGLQYGYFGVFTTSLVGALSILLPVPDSLVIFTLSGLRVGGMYVFAPVWIAATAGLGSAIGEFSGYLLGFGGRKKITGRYRKNVDFLIKVLNRFGAVAIFVFALTPLPDDLIFIPLGVTRYNPVKAILPALAGKFSMDLILAYGGRYSVGFIQNVFGLGGEFMSSLLVFMAGVVLTIIMFRIDWEKYFGKYLRTM